MHRLFYLKYFLVVSTLLIFHELKAEQTGKVLIDSDFKVTKFLNADVKTDVDEYIGHIKVTENQFVVTLPAHTYTEKDGSYRVSWPAVTITGQCKVRDYESGYAVAYDGYQKVSPACPKLETWSRSEWSLPQKRVDEYHDVWEFYIDNEAYITTDNNLNASSFILENDTKLHLGLVCKNMVRKSNRTVTEHNKTTPSTSKVESGYVVDAIYGVYGEVLNVQHSTKDDEEDTTSTWEEDNDASDEGGIWKYIIPPFVGGCLVGWWRKRRKNKKQQKDDDPEPEPEPEEEEQEEEEDDEPDQLQMQVYKDFGDTLLVGDKGQQVNALIVRKPKKGPEYVDEELTRQIQITSGDEYLHVEMGDIENGWKTAYVWAPEAENPPQEGIVKFVLANEGASYTNRLHFKVTKGGILFDPRQTNVTIPARHPEPVEVSFVVEGLPIEDIKEVTAFITDQNDEKAKEYEVRVLNCNEKADFPYKAEITDLLKDLEMDHGEPGTHVSYVLHIEARNNDGYTIKGELPLFRFYLGMQIETDGEGIGCYLEEYDPMKHLPNTRFKGDDGKQYVYSQTWCRVRIYDYDAESHSLKITEPNPLPDLLPGDGEATSECNSFIFTVEPATDVRSTENMKPESHKQNILDNIDLRLLGRPSGKDSYLYFLTCTKGVLMPPTRMAVTINLAVKLKNGLSGKWKEYKCQKLMILWSQPKRRDLTPEAWKVVIKKDEELEDKLLRTRENITRFGLSDDFNQFMEGIASGNGDTEISEKLDFFGLERYQKLETGIDILLRTYTRDFGYDENTVMSVVDIFNNYLARCQVRNITMEQQAEAEMEDAMAPAGIKEWFDNRHKAFKELNFVESMALGFVTCGTFSVLELVVNIGDAMYKAADSTESDAHW